MKDGHWSWRVQDDEIVIASNGMGRYELRLNGETVGSYLSAEAALEEAQRGTHRAVASGLRTVDLAPSDKLSDWPFTKTL